MSKDTPNISLRLTLYEAVCSNNIEIVKSWLEYGAKDSINAPNQNGETPLYRAICEDNLEIVKLLLQQLSLKIG